MELVHYIASKTFSNIRIKGSISNLNGAYIVRYNDEVKNFTLWVDVLYYLDQFKSQHEEIYLMDIVHTI